MSAVFIQLVMQLVTIYCKLGFGIGSGWLLGRWSSPKVPTLLGKWLFWIGVPISVFAFVRQIDLSASIWLAPTVAWAAMATSLAIAWSWLRFGSQRLSRQSQGSFLLASTIGNTGYLGYPISLAIAGEATFGWALFYDLLGSLLWGYGIGVMVASYYGQKEPTNVIRNMFTQVAINPALWSLVFGLLSRHFIFPAPIEMGLKIVAWGVIFLAIILIGMRLGSLNNSQNHVHDNEQINQPINQQVHQQIHQKQRSQHLAQVKSSLLIKMLIVPLIFSLILPLLGITKSICLVLVLQIGMPPAFASLIVSETYQLDPDLAVRSLAYGTCLLLLTLPIWLLLLH
jgi:malate permease and related proteins